ncbi:MAG: response regulator, partial [Oscillospiraceae bacterium]|nr:response regulator [Oscillospiraceae bacterium]
QAEVHYDKHGQELRRFIAPEAKVLIVDDITTNLLVAEGLMSQYQMEITTCTNGKDAIRLSEDIDFDIIFMDHMMPEMDGLEATARIRENGFANPILALTANAIRGVDEMFRESGMNGMLVKPIDTGKLHSALEQWLPKEKQKRVTAEEYSTIRVAPDESSGIPQIDGLNYTIGIKLAGGEIEFYKKVLGTFAGNAREYGRTIRDCLESSDAKLFTTSVHALKSASSNIGAERLSSVAEELENYGRNSDWDKIRSDTADFLTNLDRLADAIDKYLGQVSNGAPDDEDTEFLINSLEAISSSAEAWDVDATQTALNALNAKVWNSETDAIIKRISEYALCGDFDDAAELAASTAARLRADS